MLFPNTDGAVKSQHVVDPPNDVPRPRQEVLDELDQLI